MTPLKLYNRKATGAALRSIIFQVILLLCFTFSAISQESTKPRSVGMGNYYGNSPDPAGGNREPYNYFLYKENNGVYHACKENGVIAFSDSSFSAVFNNVVSALPTGGDIALAGNTIFTVGKSLNIPNKAIRVHGGGNSTVLKASAGLNAPVIYVSGDWSKGFIALEDFQIDGNKANNTSTSEHGIELYRVWNFALRNLMIHDVHGDGIYTHAEDGPKGAVEGTLTDLTIYDAFRYGIHLGKSATDYEIENIIMRTHHGLTAPTTYAVYCEGGGGAGSHFSNIHSYEFDYGFWIDWGVVSISNYHSDGNGIGIMLNGSRRVQVVNASFSQNQSGAIVMKNAFQNMVNGASVISTGNSTSDGIRIDGKSSQNIVIGAIITGYKGYGINLTSADAQNNLINNNIVSGNAAGGLNDMGTGTIKQNNITR